MDSYKVIAIFTYPSDLAIVKALLESSNINCYVRDELTVQVHNFISNAVGGIRLEVPIEKVRSAQKIIMENGFEEFLAKPALSENHIENDEHDPSLLKFIKSGVHFVIISVVILFIIIFGLIVFYE